MARAPKQAEYDVLIIGGGINGCGIARELSGRGYQVYLAEMNDLASGTSSWSSKLVHGGLRYLEQYEFKLVREALAERKTLMDMAPHLVRPARFILPHNRQMRPKWLIRLGLSIYDHLDLFGRTRRHGTSDGKSLKGIRTVSFRNDRTGQPLKPEYSTGFEYADCFVDDTRLTIINARAASQQGATIKPRHKVESVKRVGDRWHASIQSETISCKLVINAAGPWADTVLDNLAVVPAARNIRLVQGSHIIVNALFEHDQPYILQHDDGRIVFAIPYLDKFTLLGTTDTEYSGDPAKAEITSEEQAYILEVVNRYFLRQLTQKDVIASYSGVRPLFNDSNASAQKVTRDYVLNWQKDAENWLNIFGGKLTTYRTLSCEVAEMVTSMLGRTEQTGWHSDAVLPGTPEQTEFAQWEAEFHQTYAFLDPGLRRRLCQHYGADAEQIIGTARSQAELGTDFGGGLTVAEIEFLREHEWAETVSDIIWRRTKLGYVLDASQKQAISAYLDSKS